MQEDVYIGHTVLAFMIVLQAFSQTGATTTSRLLGPTTCLLHKDRGVPKDTSKLAGLFSTISLFAECQAGKL